MLGVNGQVGWPEVALALIAAAPGIIAAIASLRTRRDIRTPSGTAIGTQVEDTQHVTLANHYRIRQLERKSDMAAQAEAEPGAYGSSAGRSEGETGGG